jgi:hypothetical protein
VRRDLLLVDEFDADQQQVGDAPADAGPSPSAGRG